MDDKLVIAGRAFNSRLMVGTGKYATMEVMREAIAASGAEIVTVAVRRMNLQSPGPSLLDYLDLDKITLLPNTAGATTVEEAVRLARLAREAGLSNMVKLEIIGDEETLLPDPVATIEATRILVEEGFIVLPYTTQDVVVARRLVEAGAATVMPLGSPIGSGQGLPNFDAIKLIIDRVNVPVIVDAGIGAPSDAALAMEIGAAACLINTAIAKARDPVLMAAAMRQAVIAGRQGYLAGRIPKKTYASPSSPTEGMIGR
ncbi:MAG: thiazole synthase [Moorella humiferrea]|uniref:Thiazole synthase n=1 Tax=Neomoorella humiferrea TaxID=676965 RepID=A0A2T0AW95_9FIRM|nr:thiazole synthase [Moorella humiferrea]MBE3572605.1 thiazole synthase [Moorella humiferrea]PRR74981.1 Thiazole synthase [Moorella humiferrea]